MRSLLSSGLLLLSTVFTTTTLAQSSNETSAVFVYNGDGGTSFVFALNVESSTGDIYFHLSSPAGNAWVGVGIGETMKDALMFIAYPSDGGSSVTISPRIGIGHTEPIPQSDIVIDKMGTNSVAGNNRGFSNIEADAVCRKCATWNGGALNLANKNQPFIFAVGPPFPTMDSSSINAGMSRHIFYGQFTMDMMAATSQNSGSIPAAPYSQKNASPAFKTVSDDDPAPRIHGLVMSFVFIILLPFGALLLRVWHKIKGHIIAQTIGTVLFCMAFAGGCVVSQEFIRSKSFKSAHQIIGILLLLGMLSQLTLGFLHHRIFKREQRKTIMGKIHLYLGPTVIFFGIINGGLGFQLAGAPFLAIPYAIIVIIFLAIYTCIRGCTHFYRKRRDAAKNGPEGYQYPQFGNPAPPQYGPPSGAPPPYMGPDVPLQRIERGVSQQSVPRYEGAGGVPVEARPMV